MSGNEKRFEVPTSDKSGPVFFLGELRFQCLSAVPVGLLESVWATEGDGARIIGFVRAAVVEEDAESFDLAISSKQNPINLELLGEVSTWLVGEYSGRPLEKPASSTTGTSATEATLAVESSSPATE